MQDSMNIKLMYSAQKDKYEWPEKRDKIYYPVAHIACKTEPPVTTRNGLHNCFVTTKQMALCYIKSADFIILYGCSLLDFWQTGNFLHYFIHCHTCNKLCHTCNMANFDIFPLRWENFLYY